MGDNPVDRLVWIVGLLRATAMVHDGVASACSEHAAWLDDAIRSHVHDGVSADKAMGLVSSNGRQPRFYVLLRERNRHLRQALDLLDGDVHALLDEFERYETRVSAAQRERIEPDPLWPAARKLVHAAACLGLEIPRTPEGMRKTLGIKAAAN
jgi:hypothetical protein